MTTATLSQTPTKTFGPIKAVPEFPWLKYQFRGDHWRLLDPEAYGVPCNQTPGIGDRHTSEAELITGLERRRRMLHP